MAPQAAVIPAVNDQSQNEPETTQVVVQPATNNASPAGEGTADGTMVRLSEEDIAAIRRSTASRSRKSRWALTNVQEASC